jgi:Holliday junction resolvase RusA-like endonuclease
MTIAFTVNGNPVEQGSMVAFMGKNMKRPVVHAANDNELKKWKKQVGQVASIAMRNTLGAGKAVPIRVTARFYMSRVISEKTGFLWKAKYCTVYPDLDKLTRALLDGMTGICYDDDKQVTELHVSKEFSDDPRVEVQVEEVTVEQEMLRLVPVRQEEVPF